MEFPEEKYYKLNYILLASIGLWPYHNSSINQIQVVLSLLIYITFMTYQLIQIFVAKYTFDILLEVLSLDFLIMAWIAKYITFYAVMKNIKKFQEHIHDNWSILTDDREIDIMRKYANNGKWFTIIIATLVYFGILTYISIQYIPGLLDIILPLNESRPRKLFTQMEYFADQQKYFHVLAMYINIVIFLSATTGIATESFSLINAVHAFGMFKIASFRIKHMLSENTLRICIAKKYTILHHRIIAAVDAHRRALELSELLKTNFGRSYLLIIMIITCSGSINIFHLSRIITMEQKTMDIIISIVLIFCHFLFLILGNFAGQEFINCDSYVHQTICNTEWYNAPLKAQKLILFLLQKTTKSYRVDAGGMFSPCLEGLVGRDIYFIIGILDNYESLIGKYIVSIGLLPALSLSPNSGLPRYLPAQSCFNLREKMDFAGERYYRLNRILLTAIGLWPYNDSAFRSIQRIFFVLLLAFSICVQIGKIITSVSDLESFLQIFSFVVPCLVFSLKYSTFCIKSKDIRKIYEQIKYHWNTTKCKEELKILQRFTKIGYLMTILIGTLFYSSVYIFLMMQISPKFLDIVAPLNESRPYELLAIATFFFDQEKYFVPIFMHMTVALSVEITIIVATETMCLTCMQHACALFKIASFRIEHAFDCEIHISVAEKNTTYYTNIINAIIIHNRAIKFFEFLNSHFEISYFILLVLGVCSLSINLFRLALAGFKEKMEELVAIGLLVICHFFYMFINNFVAQRMTNCSAEIFYKTCELPWYTVSIQCQKLLQFIMQRSIKNSKFTLFIMDASLERFASLVSVSMSYFTVFWSVH